MQVGDLVYIPYFGAYGIIVSKYHSDFVDGLYKVVQFCDPDKFILSDEYGDDLELVCK